MTSETESLSVAPGATFVTPGVSGVTDFVALMKPRVMSLVVMSGLAGLVVAPGSIHPLVAITALAAIAAGAGAAAAFNMWYDRDIDSIMSRTRQRPIPAGRLESSTVLEFGGVLALLSVTVMALAVNLVAAALLATTIAFYVLVYTMWLKRRTAQNIVIGGAAGALPPVIGWAAVTGDVGLVPASLFLIIFLWTPPHFWALALSRESEYAAAGVPMLPVVAGRDATKRQILAYTVLLAAASLLPWILGAAGLVYAGFATLFSLLFAVCAMRLLGARSREIEETWARRMFGYSIVYLFMILIVLMLDRSVVA